ncbi:cysteine dioxygenase [Micromonospora inyonensis]|uniref:Mannose-6-phosphate isomerase, cupin superfamily n=1 Tax=Micromonospora inyonensis TaxID=47866 RepID=A0A1C6SGS4_9ACTN|nr:cysteine dioxygenase family protein [Micromonospora inyonensis]SCL28666.1 Mannose-6-phosphate isomerase, cupin superfamily [Micromonospora inyonensis]
MDHPYEPDLLAVARRIAVPSLPVRFDPERRWYTRLASGPDHEVWLLTWLPGQGTDLHDHGGSAGAFLVVSGALTEEVVAGGRLRPHLLAAGAGRRFGPRHVHRVTNRDDRPAVSLHVYRPALHRMTRYHLTDGRLRVAEVALAGVAW